MGKHLKQFQDLLETRRKYEELKAVSEKCFEVFETYAGITMEFIENCVENEWRELYRIVNFLPKVSVWVQFSNLKEGIINRKEFKERMSEVVKRTNEYSEQLKEKLDKAEKDFIGEYDRYFNCSTVSHKKGSAKYIYFVLSQPDVRDIIMKYLES